MAGPRLIVVTDPFFGDDALVSGIEAAAAALPAGALVVQLRDKERPTADVRALASRLRAVTRVAGAMLVVNGDARLARDVGADGVHLGRGAGTVAEARAIAGAGAWVSVAAHADADVREGIAAGADAVLVGPVFSSRSASGHGPAKVGRGLQALRNARALCAGRAAIYALGGVDASRARSCVEAGADGVAAIRAVLASAEPGAAARAIHVAAGG